LLLNTPYRITAFGEDERGTLYLSHYAANGAVYRVETPPFVRGDLDHDGHVDLVWQNANTGLVAAWLMNGVTATSASVLADVGDPAWHVVGAHDFDGDGQTDLLWQHATTGTLAVVYFNGTVPRSAALLTPSQEPDLNWQVIGTADLDLDGHPDLVWRNRNDGRLRAWLMNGSVRRSEEPLTPDRMADPAWKIAAVEDVNGDGRPDLVWQHDTSGSLVAWLMKGTRRLEARPFTPAAVDDPLWKIRAGGDFNGDGVTDLVWRHQASGALAATFLNGTVMTGVDLLVPSVVPDLSWTIVGPR
jgi:hypothetical protein